MRKLSISKLLTLLISSFSLVFSPMVYGGSGENQALVATSSTDFANTIEGDANHTGNNKIYLFCDAGGGSQNCKIRIHALIGIQGEISSSNWSKLAVSNINVTTPSSASSSQVTGSTGSFSALTDDTATGAAPGGSYKDTTAEPTMAGHDYGVQTVGDTLAGDDAAAGSGHTLGAAMTGDTTLCFSGGSIADLKYTGSLASTTDTVADLTKAAVVNEAIFELVFYNTTAIARNTIGYADGFTVGYDVTVTSNTVGTDATGCNAAG